MTNQKTMSQFLQFVDQMGIDPKNENQVESIARQFWGNDPRAVDDAQENLFRHTVPAAAATGLIYQNGPFTWMTNELISDVTYGGNILMQWMPTEIVPMVVEETVSHLSWVAPSGWQPGTQTYKDYLAQNFETTAACERDCIAGDWSAFDYNIKYGQACTTSGKLTIDQFGTKQHANIAIPRVRGGQAGFPMQTDADWARARAAIVMEQHLDWNILYGTLGGNHQWDGLYEQLTPGYIASHIVGGGAPHWANPLVVDGTSITTCDQLAEAVKAVIRFLRRRIRQHNYRVGFTDMAVVMPSAFWNYILDCLACGADTGCGTQPTGYTKADWRAERERLATGGVGYGVIEVDGIFIPVIPLEGIAVAGVDGDGNQIITGDVMVLTRRMNGMNILAQQYLNWNDIDGFLEAAYNSQIEQGGVFKTNWISENDLCFQYNLEVRGRNIIRHMPLQARIASVSIPVVLEDGYELETGFLNEYFYAGMDTGGVLTPIP
jgi:hypothetical protein